MFGGQPQSVPGTGIISRLSLITTPETGGHGYQISSPYSMEKIIVTAFGFILFDVDNANITQTINMLKYFYQIFVYFRKHSIN